MIDLILATLATYRIALMVATEEGAFGVFALIRERVDPQQETWLGRGLNCPLCVGFWVSLAIALIIPFASWQGFILHWFGLAGGAVLIQKVTEWQSQPQSLE